MEKEYRVRVSVKNNLLASACERKGVTFKDISDATGVNYHSMIGMSIFKIPLINKFNKVDERWAKVAEFLGVNPFDLVPEKFWDRRPRKTSQEVKCNEEDLNNYTGLIERYAPSLQLEDKTNVVKSALDLMAITNLTERERDILKKRFINNEELDEIAKEYKLTGQRIKRIENKALGKLRRMAVKKKIKFEDII